MRWIAFAVIAAAVVLAVLAVFVYASREDRAAEQQAEPAADPIDSHFEQAMTASGADEACLRSLAGASFGPHASLVLPSGRRLSGDEAQALAAFYAPAAERSTR